MEAAKYVTANCRLANSRWENTNLVDCHVSTAVFYCWNFSSVLFIKSEKLSEILHKILVASALLVIKD